MNRREQIDFRFVDYIPKELEEGVVYIAPEFGAVMHLCCSGCGEKISTPLSPAQWKLTFDGETISLSPSIGNWAIPCRSHYWIRRNNVEWAKPWPEDEIRRGRLQDQDDAVRHFAPSEAEKSQETQGGKPHQRSIWRRLFKRERLG